MKYTQTTSGLLYFDAPRGSGFDDAASRMRVTLKADGTGATVAACAVQASSAAAGELECVTAAAAAPLTAAGTLCTVEVEVLDGSGAESAAWLLMSATRGEGLGAEPYAGKVDGVAAQLLPRLVVDEDAEAAAVAKAKALADAGADASSSPDRL